MNYGVGNPKGEKGKDGVSPNISVNANVNNSVGTPSVSVVKSGTNANPVFTFNFQNLKGETGTTTIKTQIVNNLPSTGDTDTIYFVANNSGESENLYNEYLYVNNAWERVDSKIDLSNYIQKSNTSGLVKNDGTIDTTQYAKAIDLEPVLLWENPSPNQAMGATILSNLPDMSQYKYLVIGVKITENEYQGIQYFKVKYSTTLKTFYITLIAGENNANAVKRMFTINSSTELAIGNGYFGTSAQTYACIPVEIYGTNML